MAGPLAWPRTPGVCFAGLRTLAFDGLNSLKVPDTEANRSWIGRIRFRMGFAGYPTLRLMTLAETGTRGLLGAVIGSAGDRDEAYLGRRLLHLLRPGMLLLLDRAFDANTFLAGSMPPGRCCWPAPAAPATRASCGTCRMAPTSPTSTCSASKLSAWFLTWGFMIPGQAAW